MGKKQKYKNDDLDLGQMDLATLKDKVYLKILDTCDDSRVMSNDNLMEACLLFDEFSFDHEQARIVREVYSEIIKRAHFLTQMQISQIDHIFSRLQKLQVLKFLPNIKKDIKDRLSKVSVN